MFEKQKEQKERAALQAVVENHEQALRDMRAKADRLQAEYNQYSWKQIQEVRAREAADNRVTVEGAPQLPMMGVVLFNKPDRDKELMQEELSFTLGEVHRLTRKLNDLRRLFNDKFNS
jgi:hypothetical protein